MSKVAQIETELEKLTQAELREVRDWLDNMIEDDLEFTPEFESAIQQSERELAKGLSSRMCSLKPAMSAPCQILPLRFLPLFFIGFDRPAFFF